LNPLPNTPELRAVSRRVIWFEDPETALADPVRFAAYAMTYGLLEDMKTLRCYMSDDDMREALKNAPPGIFDGRSWAFWHLKFGMYPPPPLPTRQFPDSMPKQQG